MSGARSYGSQSALRDAFIVSAVRTPIGSFQGALSSLPAPQLGAVAIKAALERAKLAADQVDELYVGNVLSAGLGQAPARQAGRYAGVPDAVPATTVSKVCGSGLMAVVLGARSLRVGDAELVLAAGMESMSNAPYALPRARSGYRMGHGELLDLMIHDGLWDAYGGAHMGNAAELCARSHAVSRAAQDSYARASYERALHAQRSGLFEAELVPVEVNDRDGTRSVSEDEEPGRAKLDKLDGLRPAFEKNGSVTAANASKISDGAAALLLASETALRTHKLTPVARIVGHAQHAQAPEWFTTAPAVAIDKLLAALSLGVADIDLFEINEAFAVVCLACSELARIPRDKLNVHGGAVALGHPIGASGARVLVTLVHALRARGAKRGVACLCIGGGEALAVAVELC